MSRGQKFLEISNNYYDDIGITLQNIIPVTKNTSGYDHKKLNVSEEHFLFSGPKYLWGRSAAIHIHKQLNPVSLSTANTAQATSRVTPPHGESGNNSGFRKYAVSSHWLFHRW